MEMTKVMLMVMDMAVD